MTNCVHAQFSSLLIAFYFAKILKTIAQYPGGGGGGGGGVGKGGSKGAVAPLDFGGYTLLFYCCSTPRFSC